MLVCSLEVGKDSTAISDGGGGRFSSLHTFGLRTKLKIIIGNFQILTQLGNVYEVDYPKMYTNLKARSTSSTPRSLRRSPGCTRRALASRMSRIWFVAPCRSQSWSQP